MNLLDILQIAKELGLHPNTHRIRSREGSFPKPTHKSRNRHYWNVEEEHIMNAIADFKLHNSPMVKIVYSLPEHLQEE